jgi:hypothetical protein
MKCIPSLRLLASVLLVALAAPLSAQVVTETYDGGMLMKGALTRTSEYRAQTSFSANGFNYSVILNPLHPIFQDDPTANYMSILNGQNTNPTGMKVLKFGDVWDFPIMTEMGPDYSLSKGAIEVRRYTAEATGGGFGLDFWVDYHPMGADPNQRTGNVGDMHWIQVINDNWNISDPNMANRGPGKPEMIVDVDVDPPDTAPYYDGGNHPGAADNTYFFDGPRRPQSQVNGQGYFWNAELFVAKEVLRPTFTADGSVMTKGKIQIYDGVRYGFIAITPELSPSVHLLLLGSGFFIFVRLRRIRSAAQKA